MSKLLAIAFLLPLCCRAQVGVEPPILNQQSSGSLGSRAISGLEFWWVSSDLSIGSPVSSWVDRIQGATWSNGNSSTQPTNTASGVFFNGPQSQTLTNAVILCNTTNNCRVYFVAKNVRNNNINVDNFYGIFNNGTISSGVSFTGGNVVDSASQSSLFVSLTNIIQDWNVSGSGNNADSFWYTNNISTGHQGSIAATGQKLFGAFAQTEAGNQKGIFYILEVAVFTNDLTGSSATTAHNYETNTYGFKP